MRFHRRPESATRARTARLLVVAGAVLVVGAGAAVVAFRLASGPDFTSTLVALHSEQCLEAPDRTTNGATLRQGVCADTTEQRFAFTRGEGGFYTIRNAANEFCVDVRGARTDDGVPLVQWRQCTKGPNQQFALRAVPGEKSFMLVARHSGKCADVYAGGDHEGAAVMQWSCGDPTTAGNQIWRIAGATTGAATSDPLAANAADGATTATEGATTGPTSEASTTPGPTTAGAATAAAVATNPLWGKALPPAGASFGRAYSLISGEKDKGYRPRAGECSWQIHARYWTTGPDGKVYPTWHPPRDPSGCSFGHEHGADPRKARLFAKVGWIPFGYANELLAPSDPNRQRDEDHVGHKVAQGNALQAHVDGDEDKPVVKVCDELLKFHQGTHSPDALTNNLHELSYNVRCAYKDNGAVIETRFTALLPVGHPGGISVNRECDETQPLHDAIGPPSPADSPDGRFTSRALPDAVCAAAVVAGNGEIRRLTEIWTMAVFARNAGKLRRFEIFPYAFVANPSRYFDPAQPGKIGRTIDLCYQGAKGFSCDQVRRLTDRAGGAKIAWDDSRSPFNGAWRLLNANHFVVQNEGPSTVYTDVFGTRFSATSFPGAIKQYIAGNHTSDGLDGEIFIPFQNFASDSKDGIHAPN